VDGHAFARERIAIIVQADAFENARLFFIFCRDHELVGEVLRVIRQLAQEDMTMIVVTHEIHFARDVADRIIFMMTA
jgi:ABC-type histidine transport system ATPase subunit